MSTPKFAETYNLVAFLEKPKESNGFKEIIDFLNTSSDQYCFYRSIQPFILLVLNSFGHLLRSNTVNGMIVTALVGPSKCIILRSSIRSDLKLDDADGKIVLPTATIFAENWKDGNLDGGVKFHVHKICANFLDNSRRDLSKPKGVLCYSLLIPRRSHGLKIQLLLSDSPYPPPLFLTLTHSNLKIKKVKEKTTDWTWSTEHVTDGGLSFQEKVLDLEKAKTAQAKEIAILKKRVKQLEKRRKLRTPGLKRLRKIGSTSRVESSNDASLGAQEDASKQGRKIEYLDADAEVTLVNETEEMTDDPTFSVTEVVTTASANVEVLDELTLAQTLIEIKTIESKPVTTAATTVTSVRPRAKGIIFHDPEEQSKSYAESEVVLIRNMTRGQILYGTMALEVVKAIESKSYAEIQTLFDMDMKSSTIVCRHEFRKAVKGVRWLVTKGLARQKEEEANIALIESWDNTQAMMEADFELAQRLQAEEQGEITIEERSRLFVEIMNKRKKHFAKLRAEEIRRKLPTKAQKRNQMSTYLKNMAGYKHSQLKSKSYDEIQNLFDKEMKRVNTFVDMNSKKIYEHVKVEKDDQEKAEMKRHIEIVKDDEVAIDAISLATKPPVIVEERLAMAKGRRSNML
ncbi:hypothetical protein Tco_0821207 [Tanacetum coccineum]|uniref:Uncharacterized protein n=1 Tax=Tanacetum coccineum TaxID=301880 RepID=A0ABQ5ACL1_9ASTR